MREKKVALLDRDAHAHACVSPPGLPPPSAGHQSQRQQVAVDRVDECTLDVVLVMLSRYPALCLVLLVAAAGLVAVPVAAFPDPAGLYLALSEAFVDEVGREVRVARARRKGDDSLARRMGRMIVFASPL